MDTVTDQSASNQYRASPKRGHIPARLLRDPIKMFRSIHYLRGLTALAVLVFHAFLLLGEPNFRKLAIGVDIFFVISGFVMMVTLEGTPNAAKFLRARAARILPLYWAVLPFYLAVDPRPAEEVIRAAVLLGDFNQTHYRFDMVVPVAWTLSYEMLFYIILSISLALGRPWITPTAVSALAGLGVFYPSAITNTVILEFIMGMMLHRFRHLARWWMLPLGIAVIPASWPELRGLVWGPPALLVVAGFVALENAIPKSRALEILGDSSYAIYLCHLVVFQAFPELSVAMGISYGLAIGVAVHYFIELPLLESSRRRLKVIN